MTEHMLRDALASHKASTQTLEDSLEALLAQDALQENKTLRATADTLSAQYTQSRERCESLQKENNQLRKAFHDQIFQERAGIVGASKQKLALYFAQGNAQSMHRLQQEEAQVRSRIARVRTLVQTRHNAEHTALLAEVTALERRTAQTFDAAREFYTKAPVFTPAEHAAFDALAAQPLTPEQLQQVARKNDVESFVGKNLINKAGMLLIVLGVLAASQYTIQRLPDIFKGMAIFVLGALLLLCGEWLNHKKSNVVSLGITAGGVAILYVGVAASYFGLGLFGALPAILLCIVITILAFFLSQRYNTQTIAAFAFLGGYLPVLAVSGTLGLLYGLMAYLIVLNALALLLALRKRWMFCAFLGFGLNFVTSVFLSIMAVSQIVFAGRATETLTFALLAYLLFALVVYTAVPLLSVYRSKKPLAVADVCLLALNTVFSSIVLFRVIYAVNLSHLAGWVALGCAVAYLLLAYLVQKKFVGAGETHLLFTFTGFCFLALAVPLQLERTWFSLAWLGQGLVLAGYGILAGNRLWRRAGVALCGLCAAAFLFFDFLGSDSLFLWKYTALTVGSVLLYAALLQMRAHSIRVSLCKLLTGANLWIYMLYIVQKLMAQMPETVCPAPLRPWAWACAWIVCTLLLAFAYLHLRQLDEPFLLPLGLFLYVTVLCGAFWTNAFTWPRISTLSGGAIFFAALALCIPSITAMIAAWDFLRILTRFFPPMAAILLATLSGFSLLLLTQILVTQCNMSFSNLFLSVLYGASAVALVGWGFARANAPLRRFGLFLAMGAVAKLFLLDLFFLTAGYRILCYFALGISLVAISLVYQAFSKHFEVTASTETVPPTAPTPPNPRIL